ncbi:S9 family peptidase [Roseateles sp. DAIF2]|uniref:alpha/beta hydrolase family protein n=1 Tax=Roseateles sp. DAIF2 TaxID=2714952 RepID=UPI0018A32F11|nr:alpha/beta fold hydrolase [Roseateles sp. DAIF2]QPF73314.1 S9 family peptidase [Roseateles sp. DAIF2]
MRPASLLHRLAFLLILAAPPALQAQPLSYQEVFGIPTFDRAQLSPSGRHLAVLVPAHGRRQLAIMDLEDRRISTRIGVPGADVGSVMWLGDQRLVFSLAQLGQNRKTLAHAGGLYVVGRDGQEQRRLFQTAGEWFASGAQRLVQMWPQQRVPGSETELIVAANDVDEHSIDLYRLEVTSGKRQQLSSKRPARVRQWVLDAQQRPRVAIASSEDGLDLLIHYRDVDAKSGEPGPWRELWRQRASRGDALAVPLSVEADGRLLVASNEGRDTMAVREYDPALGQWGETLVEHPRYDVAVNALGEPAGERLLHEAHAELLGFLVEAEKPLYLWMDESRRALQALVDQALPGRINALQFSAGPRVLIRSHADTQPPRWYLMDRGSGRIEPLFDSRPGLDTKRLPATEVLNLQSRDGLPLLAYLMKPPGAKPGQALPAVMLVHGGPWTRGAVWGDELGDMDTARWLASRGYAVLLPSFRGSTGFGKRALLASRGQFGLTMQDDLDDVLQALLQRGDLDPQRLCIMGSSYGGYASLMAVARQPERFRCAVSGMPISDLPALLESGWSDLSVNKRAKAFWVEMAGDPKQQRAALQAVSPVHLADRIRAKVMIFAGVDDQRTPLEQAEGMRRALQRAGNEPLWLAKYGEGHGFHLSQNRGEMLEMLERFLAEQIGRKAQP